MYLLCWRKSLEENILFKQNISFLKSILHKLIFFNFQTDFASSFHGLNRNLTDLHAFNFAFLNNAFAATLLKELDMILPSLGNHLIWLVNIKNELFLVF